MDMISLNAAIPARGKEEQQKQALTLVHIMRETGLFANMMSFNATISPCEKRGQWEHVSTVLQEMCRTNEIEELPKKFHNHAARTTPQDMTTSTGGGRGAYVKSDGDIPLCIRTRHETQTQPAPEEGTNLRCKTNAQRSFTIIHKNARGLCTDDHIQEMMRECEAMDWDVVLLNETWRTDPHEHWILSQGHVFLGAASTRIREASPFPCTNDVPRTSTSSHQ